MSNDKHVCTIYIKAEPAHIWEALTTPEFTRRYFHATDIQSDWKPGSSVTYFNQDGSTAVKGEILIANPFKELSFTWHVHYNELAKQEQASKVTFLLDQVEDSTKLTLIHEDFPENSVVFPQISEGWIAILSNLKTLLETDSVMAVS
ncbi:MAG: SRPBCC family protein [Gammaproteobacteria bacterium]|nr:SRPBCC family protein [Gammaproteobacteria bacterium]